MNYLYNATDDWINIPNMIMNYEDENIDYNTQEKGTTGYGKVVTTNNITKITKKDGSAVTVLTDKEGYTNLKARLPRYNEVTGTGKCTTDDGSCPLYLVNYLSSSSYVKGEGLQNISGIDGYWTSSSCAVFTGAWHVHYYGSLKFETVPDNYLGVRPVINVKL